MTHQTYLTHLTLLTHLASLTHLTLLIHLPHMTYQDLISGSYIRISVKYILNVDQDHTCLTGGGGLGTWWMLVGPDWRLGGRGHHWHHIPHLNDIICPEDFDGDQTWKDKKVFSWLVLGWALEEQVKLSVIQQCKEGGYVVIFKSDLYSSWGDYSRSESICFKDKLAS